MKNTLLLIAFGLISVLGISQTNEDPVMTFAQKMPTYPEGEETLYNLLYQNVTYPELEKSMNIEGTVFIRFVVEKDGTPTQFKVERGVFGGAGLDSAALFACKQLGKFNPGTQDGVPQRVYLTIPVKFTLEDDAPVAELQLTAKELKEIENDAKYICEMINDIVDLQVAGDTIKVNALSKTFEPKMAELQKKYPKGSVFEKKLEEFVKPCMEEAMKRFPNEQSEVQEEIKLSNREIKRIKKDGKYICDMVFKLVEAQKSNDQSKVEKLTAEFDKKAAALKKKYPEGSAKEDRLEDIVKPCLEEAMKAAMGN
jgi:TonB family protein